MLNLNTERFDEETALRYFQAATSKVQSMEKRLSTKPEYNPTPSEVIIAAQDAVESVLYALALTEQDASPTEVKKAIDLMMTNTLASLVAGRVGAFEGALSGERSQPSTQ